MERTPLAEVSGLKPGPLPLNGTINAQETTVVETFHVKEGPASPETSSDGGDGPDGDKVGGARTLRCGSCRQATRLRSMPIADHHAMHETEAR